MASLVPTLERGNDFDVIAHMMTVTKTNRTVLLTISLPSKGNERLLDLIKDLSGFLEIGMKYNINVENKENKYCLEIEAI